MQPPVLRSRHELGAHACPTQAPIVVSPVQKEHRAAPSPPPLLSLPRCACPHSRSDPQWIAKHTVGPAVYNSPSGYNSTNLGVQEGGGQNASVFVSGPAATGPAPLKPVAGTHLVPLAKVGGGRRAAGGWRSGSAAAVVCDH